MGSMRNNNSNNHSATNSLPRHFWSMIAFVFYSKVKVKKLIWFCSVICWLTDITSTAPGLKVQRSSFCHLTLLVGRREGHPVCKITHTSNPKGFLRKSDDLASVGVVSSVFCWWRKVDFLHRRSGTSCDSARSARSNLPQQGEKISNQINDWHLMQQTLHDA